MNAQELWGQVSDALDGGDFSRVGELLESHGETLTGLVGTHDESHRYVDNAFACACFLGHTSAAAELLDMGADPAACNTGQTGLHYAVMNGHLDTVEMLLARNVPMEVKNMYGGSALGQALWSAVNEPRDTHPAIIEALVDAGAEVPPEE